MKVLFPSFAPPEKWRNPTQRKKLESEEWKALRQRILARDNFTCAHCGYSSDKYQIVDHIDGDPENNSDANFQIVCQMCNLVNTLGKAVLSDCGKVYTKSFGIECKALGTKSIHTRPYNPKCNGKAEAVVKKIKTFLKHYYIRNLEHMNELLKQFQKQYNNTPHSGIKYMTPLELFKAKQRSGLIWAVG